MKVQYSEAVNLFTYQDGKLVWKAASKGRRKQGSEAGSVNKANGQVVIEIGGTPHHASHIVWLLHNKSYPESRIEHINGDKLDNRIENLRCLSAGRSDVTGEVVRDIFDYKDGILVWKKPASPMAKVNIGGVAGFTSPDGYRYIKIAGKRYKAANLVWAYHKGSLPKSILDHINHDRADDSIENLREVTPSENSRNTKLRRTNTSGHPGVSRREHGWVARISDGNGDSVHLGSYRSKGEAIAARKAAEKMVGGYHKNHGSSE